MQGAFLFYYHIDIKKRLTYCSVSKSLPVLKEKELMAVD